MGVFFCITILVMHPVHYAISVRYQVRRTLSEPGKEVKDLFSLFTGSVHLVGCVTMEEEGMEEQG